jgi:hypothetical protein
MEIIWQTLLFRLAEHAQTVVPLVLGLLVLGLGPIGRAIARRISGGEAGRQELDSLRQQVAELQERADYNDRILGTLRRQLPPETSRPADGDTATPS